jgi:hypothetical protein
MTKILKSAKSLPDFRTWYVTIFTELCDLRQQYKSYGYSNSN